MHLTQFTPSHSELVASWAPTPTDLSHWAALSEAPTDETFARWHAATGVHTRLLIEGAPVAYGELWVSEEEDEVELARLLVAPDCRTRGVGRALVRLLVEEARSFPVSTAWVRVVPENVAALRCYAAAGFTRASLAEEAEFNAAQPRAYRWLRLAL